MTLSQYQHLDTTATKYATSTGYLIGYLQGLMLYDDNISPDRFKNMYNTIVESYKITNSQISESDMLRFKKRASELGVIL